jgi:hypothetical protein
MRSVIISTLAATLATLVGCTWVAPKQTQQASVMGNGAAGALQMDSKTVAKTKTGKKEGRRHRMKAITQTKNAKSNTAPNVSSYVQPNDGSNALINEKSTAAPKTETPQSSQPDNTSNASINAKSTVIAKTEIPQSSQLDDKFDPVIKKAIPTIAAKMENSASVELVEMKRAEKNAFGKSIDTICGYVRGRTASGAETGDRPFLYLVRENQAYIGGYDMATSPYHNLCRQ